MAKRKYSLYIVAGEFCEEEFESYRDAFKEYQRCETATLYGMPTYDASACEVIMSK